MDSIWTAPPVDRSPPDGPLGEREALEAWLDFHRDTLRWKCAGLTAEQLKQRAVPPSKLSLLGLVRHMTEVERWWFRIHAADEDMAFPYSSDDNEEADFDDLDTADAQADLEAFLHEVEQARAAVRGKQLDDVVRSHGPDLIRERIDGATGD